MTLLNGKLAKMLILAHLPGSDSKPKPPPVPFPVMYNPKSFQNELKVCYSSKQADGGNSKELSYKNSDGGTVSFEFLFDATGASVNSIQGQVAKTVGSVDVQIDLFHRLTVNRDSNTHQPNELELVWGTFYFKCRLTQAKVNYTLFNSDGRPLRATINATFKSHEPLANIAALSKIFSADLTHIYIVKAGETLPYITEKTYGDASYYLEVARVNNLKNFRMLKPGTQLILPPLNKREN